MTHPGKSPDELVILGINDSHDASAALAIGGKLVCALSEERIQRIKSTGGFPLGAIEACLAFAGLTRADIDHVAVAGNRAVPVNLLSTLATFTTEQFFRIQEEIRHPRFYEDRDVPFSQVFPDYRPKGNVHYPLDQLPLKETRQMSREEQKRVAELRLDFIAAHCGVPRERVVTLDHHTCHAYHAYYAGGLRGRPVTALTMDAGGDGVYDSVNVFAPDGSFRRLHASHDCVIGPIYSMVTLLLGMRPHEHEFKVMGLAPYAKEHVKQRTREILQDFMTLDGYRFRRNPDVRDFYWYTKEKLKYERFDGIAGGLQDFAEHFLTRWVAASVAATDAPDVVFSGGVALNVKANQCIAKLPAVASLSIPAGSGDEGLSVGAIWALRDRLDPTGAHRESIAPLDNAYLGPAFEAGDVDAFAAHANVRGRLAELAGDATDHAARVLENQGILAVCHGRMEFGPRALGHRSILANPSTREAVTHINDAVKGRDFWMPFAPSIMREHAADYVVDTGRADLRYMTACTGSTPAGRDRLVATVHPYDQTMRPQLVDAERNPAYHALLRRFHGRTGLGGVLNTSLNIHGKPIVMKPVDIAEELLADERVAIDGFLIGDRFFAPSPA